MRLYRGINFNKEVVEKITGSKSLNDYNVRFAVRIVERLYEKNFSSKEIVRLFNVNENLINKILIKKEREVYKKLKPIGILDKKIEYTQNRILPIEYSLRNKIGRTTYRKLLNSFSSNPTDIKTLLKEIYRLWHKLGSSELMT